MKFFCEYCGKQHFDDDGDWELLDEFREEALDDLGYIVVKGCETLEPSRIMAEYGCAYLVENLEEE